MVKLLVTEGTVSKTPAQVTDRIVRAFIADNYSYGFWISEKRLLEILPDKLRGLYFSDRTNECPSFDIPAIYAMMIVYEGQTIESKAFTLRQLSERVQKEQ